MDPRAIFDRLNPGQAAAVRYGIDPGARSAATPPLLIIAGAGSGKTHTLAHRVANLILNDADPRRILLLTFTRRAAAEMTRRARRICRQIGGGHGAVDLPWSGTFHGIANRLLRMYAEPVGLDPSFTVLDRGGGSEQLPLLHKYDVALRILDRIADRIAEQRSG